MKAKINGFIFFALIIVSGLFLLFAKTTFAASDRCCVLIKTDNSKVCSLLTDTYTATDCFTDSYANGNKNSFDVTCDDSDVCKNLWSAEKLRAVELESINQQEAALNSANFWSCYMEFKEKAPDTTETGITRFSETTICKDYKQAGSPNESVAEKKCLDTCDRKANPDSACLSLFIRSKSCQDLQNSNENITYKGVPLSELSVRVKPSLNALNKLGDLTISQLIGRGIRVLMSVLGSIALMIFIYSGLLWMTSRGDSSKAETSRNTMLWATLGVVVVLTSYAIVDFLFGTVFK